MNATGDNVILKRATQGLLPPEGLNKPKTGFGVPLAKWFRTGLADLLKTALLDDPSSQPINASATSVGSTGTSALGMDGLVLQQ